MMKLTIALLLLLIATWSPIASVTATDVNDDPRYLAAREFRNDARADWIEAKAELASARQAYAVCIASGDPPDIELNPIAQRVQLAVDAAARAEDRFTNADVAATQVLMSIVNPPSTSRSATEHENKQARHYNNRQEEGQAADDQRPRTGNQGTPRRMVRHKGYGA